MSVIRCERNTCTGRHGYSERKVCKYDLVYTRGVDETCECEKGHWQHHLQDQREAPNTCLYFDC